EAGWLWIPESLTTPFSLKSMLMIVKRCPAESEHHVFSIQIRTSQQPGSLGGSFGGNILSPRAGDHGPWWEMFSCEGHGRSCQFGGIPLAPRAWCEAVVQIEHVPMT